MQLITRPFIFLIFFCSLLAIASKAVRFKLINMRANDLIIYDNSKAGRFINRFGSELARIPSGGHLYLEQEGDGDFTGIYRDAGDAPLKIATTALMAYYGGYAKTQYFKTPIQEKCPEDSCLLHFDKVEGAYAITMSPDPRKTFMLADYFPLLLEIESRGRRLLHQIGDLDSFATHGYERETAIMAMVKCLQQGQGQSTDLMACSLKPLPGDDTDKKLVSAGGAMPFVGFPALVYGGEGMPKALSRIAIGYRNLTHDQRADFANKLDISGIDVDSAKEQFMDLDEDIYQSLVLKEGFDENRDGIKILAMGDQGDPGPSAHVALSMATACKNIDCSFGIGVGDNAYPKGPRISDNNWQIVLRERFLELLAPLFRVKPIPFLMALGNHDLGIDVSFLMPDTKLFGLTWLSSVFPFKQEDFVKERISRMDAQVAFTEITPISGLADSDGRTLHQWTMPGSYYHKVIEHNGIRVLLIALETSYFPNSVGGDPSIYASDKKHLTPEPNAQGAWLEGILQAYADMVDFKIVFGHHALASAGQHGSDRIITGPFTQHEYTLSSYETTFMTQLRDNLLEPFLCKYGVDLYVTGHDHVLSLDELPCSETKKILPQVLSGASAKSDGHKVAKNPHFLREKTTLRWLNGIEPDEANNFPVEGVEDMYGFFTLTLKRDLGDNKKFMLIDAYRASPGTTRKIKRFLY